MQSLCSKLIPHIDVALCIIVHELLLVVHLRHMVGQVNDMWPSLTSKSHVKQTFHLAYDFLGLEYLALLRHSLCTGASPLDLPQIKLPVAHHLGGQRIRACRLHYKGGFGLQRGYVRVCYIRHTNHIYWCDGHLVSHRILAEIHQVAVGVN